MNNDKGRLNGICNSISCQNTKSVTWYNHKVKKYYCEDCAKILNAFELRRDYAMKLYGHELCTPINS